MSTEISQQNLKTLIAFAPIPQFEGYYSAGSDGNIYSHRTGGKLKAGMGGSGYYGVTLCMPGYRKQASVHTFICSAFHGHSRGREVNHKNGIKTDNRPTNLEWVTRSQNQCHAAEKGLKPKGEESHLSKLTKDQVLEIKMMISEGIAQTKIAKQFGVSQTAISKIKTNKKWKHLQ